ncbi:hypothetical protein BH18ACI4_BH18ACI4_01500 [soil metagenome]
MIMANPHLTACSGPESACLSSTLAARCGCLPVVEAQRWANSKHSHERKIVNGQHRHYAYVLKCKRLPALPVPLAGSGDDHLALLLY